MDANSIITLLSYTLPSLITGGVAYYLFTAHFKDQENTRRWLLQRENKPALLPLRLQAYERMVLFTERINPSQLLVRVAPISSDTLDYQNYIIAQIEQEFEHNLAQQIYLTVQCWSVILTAKNATIQMIRLAAQNEKVQDADSLRTFILTELFDKETPTSTALAYIKQEVSQLW